MRCEKGGWKFKEFEVGLDVLLPGPTNFASVIGTYRFFTMPEAWDDVNAFRGRIRGSDGEVIHRTSPEPRAGVSVSRFAGGHLRSPGGAHMRGCPT